MVIVKQRDNKDVLACRSFSVGGVIFHLPSNVSTLEVVSYHSSAQTQELAHVFTKRQVTPSTPGTTTERNPSRTKECSSYPCFFIKPHVLRPVKCSTWQIKHQQEEKQSEKGTHNLMKQKENVFSIQLQCSFIALYN